LNTVLITGASSGVGAATARRLGKDGKTVLLVARSADALDAVAREIGPNATAFPCDASDPDAVATMASAVIARFGVPDGLINSAGAGQWKTVQDTTPQEAVQMMQAPYFAAFNVTHAFLSGMLERGSGVIAHVNSPACYAPWPSSAGYAASRAALRGLHEAMSQDLVGTGVHSCHVVFSEIASPYFENNPGVAEKIPLLAKTIPKMSPDECAKVLANVLARPRLEVIRPFMLKPNALIARLFPRVAPWAVRF
jgi:short-subunit dehydrogenase